MKRSAKNYLCIVCLAAALSFAAACIIKAHELQAFADESHQQVSSSIQGWHIGAAASATCAGLVGAWLVLSKGNALNEKEVLNNQAHKGILTAAAVGGLAIGYAASCGGFGQIGKLDLPAEPVETAKAEPEEEPAVEETPKEVVITADTFPVAEDKPKEEKKEEQEAAKRKGVLQISDTQELFDSYSSSQSDESALLISKDGNAALGGAVSKTGNASSSADALTNGINAAICVETGGTLAANGANIQTDGQGAPGISVNGGKANLDSAVLVTSQKDSEALFADEKGSITGVNVQAVTQGESSPALIAGKDGSISMDASYFTTTGNMSSFAQGAGSFVITNTGVELGNAPGALLNGAGSLRFDYSSLFTSIKDGIFQIKNEKSSDASASISITGSSIQLAQGEQGAAAALFDAENAKGSLLLNGNIIVLPSGQLASLKSSQLALTLDGQTIEGRVVMDESSEMQIDLKNGSVLSTALNTDQKGKKLSLHLDAGSYLYLIGDCYLSSFDNDQADNSNISLNGYTIYVNGKPLF